MSDVYDLYVDTPEGTQHEIPTDDLSELLGRLTADQSPEAKVAAGELRANLAVADELGRTWSVRSEWRRAVLDALGKFTYRSRRTEAFHKDLARS